MDLKPKINFAKGSGARAQINKEFYDPKWDEFRKWYFKSFSREEFEYFVDSFYEFCEKHNEIIHYVPWFFNTFVKEYISVIERDYKLQTGQIQKSVFPPQSAFQIEKNNKQISFTAFSKLLENDMLQITTRHINQLLEKQNFTNLYMTILGEEIISLQDRVERIISAINQIKPDVHIQEKRETDIVFIASSSIQPPPEVKDFKFKNSVSQPESFIEEKFKAFNISALDNDTDNIEEINKMKWADKPTHNKYYYNRPTPVDVLHEEQEYIISNSYNGKSIYEWNVDGNTDKHIFTLAHRMLMYSTVCKTANNTDKNIAKMIIAGFTGQLKGWWDNYLNLNQKNDILGSIKNENGSQVENAVYSLITTMIEHFTGRYTDNSDTIRTLLSNLRCKTLTDFRWYKDTFLSRIFELP